MSVKIVINDHSYYVLILIAHVVVSHAFLFSYIWSFFPLHWLAKPLLKTNVLYNFTKKKKKKANKAKQNEQTNRQTKKQKEKT